MRKYIFIFLGLLYVVALCFLSYQVNQNDFVPIVVSFSIAFLAYWYFYVNSNFLSFQKWKWIFLFCSLIPLFSTPKLSPDVYRFIWDGDIMQQGINPFSYAPKDLIQTEFFEWTERLKFIYYNGMTDLSKKHFSVYPSLNQFYFFISSYLTKDISSFFIVMRISMLLTHWVGFVFIVRILDFLSIRRTKVLMIALNPLVIIECMGNFHFEGVMLSFLSVALYYLMKKQLLQSALFWAFAVNIKLTPLLLLPMTFKFLKLRKSIVFYFLTMIFTLVLLGLVIWPSLFYHFWLSVQLYFNNFEFNSSLFKLFSYMFFNGFNENLIPVIGPILSVASMVIIVLLALLNPKANRENMIRFMMFGYVIYLLFATTVHPWYILIPLVLSMFTNFKFVMAWSFITTLSYVLYDDSIANNFIILGSNILLGIWILIELISEFKGKALNYR